MEGRTDGCIKGWREEWMEEERMKGRTDEGKNGWREERMEGRTDGGINEWREERMEG